MGSQIVLSLILWASSTAGPELCAGVVNKIEPEMRIRETDLTREKAAEAAAKLRDLIERGHVDGEFQHGALNQLKIVHGHILLQQARNDSNKFGQESAEARDSTDAFCRWLVKDGFWYD